MDHYTSPQAILDVKKPVRIHFRASDDLVALVKQNEEVQTFIEEFTKFYRKVPNQSEILRFALCVFAFHITQNNPNNELIPEEKEN